MNIAAAVAGPFQPALTRGDDDKAIRLAWGAIAGHLRDPLSSLLAFMEFAEVYRHFSSSADRDLRHRDRGKPRYPGGAHGGGGHDPR